MNAQLVIFRMDRAGKNRQVTALLPGLPANRGNIVCYAHLGQHSEASLEWVRSRTRPATADEYAPLLRELRSIYGTSHGPDDPAVALVVRKRIDRRLQRKAWNWRARYQLFIGESADTLAYSGTYPSEALARAAIAEWPRSAVPLQFELRIHPDDIQP